MGRTEWDNGCKVITPQWLFYDEFVLTGLENIWSELFKNWISAYVSDTYRAKID